MLWEYSQLPSFSPRLPTNQGNCVKFHHNSSKNIKSIISSYEQFSLKREKWICHSQEGLPTGTTYVRQHTRLMCWVLTWNSICWLSLMENPKCKIRNTYYKPWVLIFKNGYVYGQFYFVWTRLWFGFPPIHSGLPSMSAKGSSLVASHPWILESSEINISALCMTYSWSGKISETHIGIVREPFIPETLWSHSSLCVNTPDPSLLVYGVMAYSWRG